MRKVILAVIAGLLLYADFYAQQKTFGYKISGGGDVLSDVFLIANGMKIDSMVNYTSAEGLTYKFEYYPNGKLKSDYNYISFKEYRSGYRTLEIPAYRQYTYNERGDIDSIAYYYWYNNKLVDQPGYKSRYVYGTDGKILSQADTREGEIFRTYEYSYDSFGNLTQTKWTSIYTAPTIYYDVWEYDSLDRLILKKSYDDSKYPSWDQYVYKYNPDGTIDCTIQNVSTSSNSGTKISNSDNFNLQFDKNGKLINETLSYYDNLDSTWIKYLEFPAVYDSKGRIIEFGNYKEILFHYNSIGNLDSLLFKRAGNEGYFANRASLMDSYGNKIALGGYSFGLYNFYYSKLTTGINEKNNNIDINFSLSQNYPNPFNPTTLIKYNIPRLSKVTLSIYDLLGREVERLVDEEKPPGQYEVKFNANGLSSGIYFYRMQAGSFFDTKKLILLK